MEPAAIDTYCKLGDSRQRYTKLEMEDSFLDLLGAPLIPVLRTDIAASTSCTVHLGLIAVVTVGALPNELAVLIVGDLDLTVEATYLTVVALGVELRVHDVVVDELHYTENCLNVVLHIGNLDVGDSATGRELLDNVQIE